MRTAATRVVGAVLAAGVLAGCGAGSGGASSASPSSADASLGKVTTGPDGVQQVTLQTQDDYVFTPGRFTVNSNSIRIERSPAARVGNQRVRSCSTG